MKSQVNNRPKCPVSDEGCSPVVTLTTDMKWVKRGAFAAIGQFMLLLATLLAAGVIFMTKTLATHYPTEVKAAEMHEDAR